MLLIEKKRCERRYGKGVWGIKNTAANLSMDTVRRLVSSGFIEKTTDKNVLLLDIERLAAMSDAQILLTKNMGRKLLAELRALQNVTSV